SGIAASRRGSSADADVWARSAAATDTAHAATPHQAASVRVTVLSGSEREPESQPAGARHVGVAEAPARLADWTMRTSVDRRRRPGVMGRLLVSIREREQPAIAPQPAEKRHAERIAAADESCGHGHLRQPGTGALDARARL